MPPLRRLMIDDIKSAGLEILDLTESGTEHRERGAPPAGVIIHSPGVTFASKVKDVVGSRWPDMSVFDDLAAKRFDRMRYVPGYLVGQTGKIYMLERDDRRTMHSGSLYRGAYGGSDWVEFAKPLGSSWTRHGRMGWVVYDWWKKRYGQSSPTDIFPWSRYPNHAIGLDLLPNPEDGSFSEEQLSSARELVGMLADVHRFPVNDRHVVTHSFASPCERGTLKRKGKIIGVHWDPPLKKFNYSEFIGES